MKWLLRNFPEVVFLVITDMWKSLTTITNVGFVDYRCVECGFCWLQMSRMWILLITDVWKSLTPITNVDFVDYRCVEVTDHYNKCGFCWLQFCKNSVIELMPFMQNWCFKHNFVMCISYENGIFSQGQNIIRLAYAIVHI